MRRSADLALPVAVIGILGMMIVPLPSALLDIMLTMNISLSLLTLFVTMYILKPVEFSVFPSLLLVLTLYRLALNVASASADGREPETATGRPKRERAR